MTKIDEMASVIMDAIKEANSILLHCHPFPDPDSVGSVLATKFALEQIGKKVVIIKGDSNIPQAFIHFPGAREIVSKNFGEVDLDKFDLFLILDSGSKEMISQKKVPDFPLPIKTVVIDHHSSNKSYADINLVEPTSPSTTYLLYNLFKKWNIEITHDIAINLFMGMYTDTGGFKYPPVDYLFLQTASELSKIAPDFTKTISEMENSNSKEFVYFEALALNSMESFLDDKLIITFVSNKDLKKKNIKDDDIKGDIISNILKSIIGCSIGASMVEREPNFVKISFRTRDSEKFDVSKLAVALGGGGHRAAAGACLKMPIDEAVKKLVETVKLIYNL